MTEREANIYKGLFLRLDMGSEHKYWCNMCGGKPDNDIVEVRYYDDFPDKMFCPELCK